MAPPTPERPACPTCAGHGLARSVLSKGGMRTVTYECGTCQHKWDVTDAEPPSIWSGQRYYLKT